jgi:hypothetical protein
VTTNRVLIGSRDKRLHCIQRTDGKPVWTFQTRGKVESSPVVAGDRVIVGSDDGRLYIVSLADGLWVTLGSDHTDRKAEAMGVALSKQLCSKVLASRMWRHEEVAGHWDQLVLRAWATIDGQRVLYQQGAAAAIRRPEDLIARCCGASGLAAGTLMFCGTLNSIGGVRPGTRFEMELDDPVLGRKLTHAYDIEALPVIS